MFFRELPPISPSTELKTQLDAYHDVMKGHAHYYKIERDHLIKKSGFALLFARLSRGNSAIQENMKTHVKQALEDRCQKIDIQELIKKTRSG